MNSIPCYSDCFYAGIGQNRHGRKKTDGNGSRPQDQDRNSFEFPERDVIKKLEILIILKLEHYLACVLLGPIFSKFEHYE